MSNLMTAPTPKIGKMGSDNRNLSVAVVGPDSSMRQVITAVLTSNQYNEYEHFPDYFSISELEKLREHRFDVVIIDLDKDHQHVLQLVEQTCASGSETVFIYSSDFSSEKMMQCMQAGAREYLTKDSIDPALVQALDRVSVRKMFTDRPKKSDAKFFSFLGCKGGVGTTTLAVNFAVALAREKDKKTLLIDLDLPLGDAALTLGVSAQYSIFDALTNYTRLDSNFLSSLLTKHSCGLSILSAPSDFTASVVATDAIDRLMAIAQAEFDYVVVDLGTRADLRGVHLFAETSSLYLVAQAGISELRNANRLLSEILSRKSPKVELVINRSTSRSFGIDEAHIEKALGRSAQWKVPDDYSAVKNCQNTATAIASQESSIGRSIRQMAEAASNKKAIKEKKKYFSSLFFSKS